MNELMNMGNGTNSIITASSSANGFMTEILNAIPLALAAPVLAYQKTRAQKELIALAIEAKRRERTEILKTMQILAKYGQLAAELSQQLMVAYYQQPY